LRYQKQKSSRWQILATAGSISATHEHADEPGEKPEPDQHRHTPPPISPPEENTDEGDSKEACDREAPRSNTIAAVRNRPNKGQQSKDVKQERRGRRWTPGPHMDHQSKQNDQGQERASHTDSEPPAPAVRVRAVWRPADGRRTAWRIAGHPEPSTFTSSRPHPSGALDRRRYWRAVRGHDLIHIGMC